LIRELYGQGSNIYDDAGYTDPGLYWWKVRAVGKNEFPMSRWSEQREFRVTAPVAFAALGDSITHGGGAISTPPGYLLYDWESYSAVPVKNLGFSGDTVDAMLARFDTDVLAFSPKVLVIMGGVNNFREGGTAAHIINVLSEIRARCRDNGIVPVFVTAAPINPELMAGTYGMEVPVDGWQWQQILLNDWILRQLYAIDITSALTDADGCLRADRTSDGLHPDMEGKKYIGETIGRYLLRHFSQFISRNTTKSSAS
jgi:lysophospholipase L1-like esterase